LGVDIRLVARSVELRPLAYLLGLGFLRPADKGRLAAGHGETPGNSYTTRRWMGISPGGEYRCEVRHTRRRNFFLARDRGPLCRATPLRAFGGGMATDPTVVGDTAKLAARL